MDYQLQGKLAFVNAGAHGIGEAIADLLTAEGEPTLGGGRHWQPWSVRAALRPYNPGPRTLAHDRREAP
jgi:NAD(P)-dependent dehydrogenase (short-subunit alcohol dehydrogenase family)